MTSYSLLGAPPRIAVVATWPGEMCDNSAKVTTLDAIEPAQTLAWVLTELSEAAWNAAAFLDTHPIIEATIAELMEMLRGPSFPADAIVLPQPPDLRHGDEISHDNIVELLRRPLPQSFAALTRAQRLSVADELAADAQARAEALRTLPNGLDPEQASSRVWQACEVTRSTLNGVLSGLPGGAAGWLQRTWNDEGSPARRWGGREQLVRIEQLVAACVAHGGRARAEEDAHGGPIAHLVLPSPDELNNSVFYVRPAESGGLSWPDPFAPMAVDGSVGFSPRQRLGEVVATDDDGFAKLLGEWTRSVPYFRPTDTPADPRLWD